MRITGSEPANLTGSLLVALPSLLDPNFRRTILFMVNHDPSEGAMGVILNRPKGTRVADLGDNAADSLPEGLDKVAVFEGGPVEKQQLIQKGKDADKAMVNRYKTDNFIMQNFKPIKVIGKGSFGEVTKAVDIRIDKVRAIKKIKKTAA